MARELGCGNMNLRELVEQALSVNVDAIILERHKNWVNESPIESLKLSAHSNYGWKHGIYTRGWRVCSAYWMLKRLDIC